MTVTGAGSNYNGIVAQPQNKTNVAFANAFVTAEGVMNADHVTGIWFKMTQNEDAIDPLTLKLFKGDTQLNSTVTADGDGYKFTFDEAATDGTLTLTVKGDFLITADVGAKAQVDITKIASTGQPEGITPFTAGTSMAVENPGLVFMSSTPQTIYVGNTPLTFYDEGGPEGKYVNDQNDRTITFIPKNEGKVVQIDFSEFNLYYSSYGTPAQFKVYSGTTSGGTLLWEPAAQADYTTGPGTTLRGIPADGGAITIIFNAKTTSSYSTKDGWTATVSEYQPVQMTATAIEVTQTKTTDASIGGTNEALLTFNIKTEGSLNALTLSAVNIDLKGTHTQMDKLWLYATGNTDAEPSAAAVGSVDVNGPTATLTLSEAVALNEGDNYFRLTTDVKGSVLPETTIDAALSNVVLSGNTIAATAGDPEGQRTLKDMILMSATGNILTVQDGRPVAFYDEGGAQGGIVSKTNGKTTFLSGADGKKVMVDFTKNEIWHGSLYNQELRIYNGQEVKEENLIKTLQQGETGVVHSTADDGSMTVVLYSNASNEVAANGWEATVNLFAPVAMDFNGQPTASAASTETLCADDMEQDMLTINVKAQNTEPAMQVTKMAFNAGENFALVTKASLFIGNNKVGETEISAADFIITLSEATTLTEGDNIFTLKYDISGEALNDQKVSAQLTSVTALVNNTEKTEMTTNAAAVQRTVNNVIQSYKDQGTVTKIVNGSVAFETKPTSEYSSNYEAGNDTRTNIFIPKHEGSVCQIDFSQFDVYYSSSTYSTRAKFIIYAGQGTSGEKLWELTSNADQKVGPGTIVRSTADDGALTVVFSPNTSSTYYLGTGWKATVSEYQLKDMAVSTVEVAQASTADASIGAAEQDLLTVNVKTEGALNPISVSSMKLNMKETETNMTKVSVWHNDTKVGEATAAAEVDVNFTEAVELTEGDNMFTVKADVSSSAPENGTIDAKLISLTAGSVVNVTAGDPEGTRTLKNQVVMTNGNHGIMYLDKGQTIAIYDDGGPAANGEKVESAVVTFAPTGDADCILLNGDEFSLNYAATINIYKGSEVNDEKKVASYTGSAIKFQPIISDAAEDGGMLTMAYKYTGSSAVNFKMTAEGYKKTDVVVTSITTEDISVGEVLTGQTDVKMLKVVVEAQGELTPLNITAFDISTTGEALCAQHIYTTGTASSFSANNEFTDSYSIEKTGTYYFWITGDVNTEATVGQTASMKLNSITAGGQTLTISGEPATASITVASGKSGTYTVGASGAQYITIQQAVDDIAALGMEGPVTLKIKAGNYNEKVRVPYIKGMGSVNTLTIESGSGQRDVKIYHNNYTTGGYSDDQHKKDYGVITLYEASYVTLKNLEIYTTDKAYKAVVMVKDQSRHVTIDNCYLHAPICTANTGEDVCLVGHTIIDEENKNNDYLTVKNCLLEGGKMGVSMGGTSYVALPKEIGGIIEGNTFLNNGQKAIYVMDELGVKIRNNTIILEPGQNNKISVGVLDMQLRDAYNESSEITGNIFNVAPKSYCSVMNFRQMEGTESAPVIIANNVINLTSPNSSTNPIKFSGAKMRNVNVAHNTMVMKGTNGGAAFWLSSKLDEGYGNINIVNNIIQNETNGAAVSIYDDANATKLNFSNNVIYTAGSNFYLPNSNNYNYFVSTTGAIGTVNKQVSFLSDNALEPANDLDGDLLTAQALSYVTTDLNGKTRPATSATIGAYEYQAEDAALVMNEGFPKAMLVTDESADIHINANGNGTAWLLILPATDEAPTAEAILAQGSSVDIMTNKTIERHADELTKDQQYIAYVVLQSLRGTLSQVYPTDVFTATSTPIDPEPEQLVVKTHGITTPLGQQATLSATLTGGRAPYTVTWYNSKKESIKTETLDELPTAALTVDITPEECMDYVVSVSDARNVVDSDTARVITTGNSVTATFESLWLNNESYWNAKREDGKNNYTSFVNGSYRFHIDNTYNGAAWSGFGYSNRTSTAYTVLAHQYNSAPGGAYDGSDNYAVFYYYAGGSRTIDVLNSNEGDSIRGFYITNNAYAKSSMTNGDSFAKRFAQGDWFKVTVTADNGNEAEFYLADFRSSNTADHYILDTWEWFDLSSLGKVKTLSFSMSSSDVGQYGVNTPTYLCMDNFNGQPAWINGQEQTSTALSLSTNIADLTSLKVAGATTTWTIVNDLPDGVTAQLDNDGQLTVTAPQGISFDLYVKVSQRGRTEFIRIPISLGDTSTEGADVTITTEGLADDGYYYATMFYGTKALIVPDDVTAQTYRVDNGALTLSHSYAAGETIPAGQGVVLKASTTGVFHFDKSNETGTADANSMLYGSDEEYQDNENGYTYYILTTPKVPRPQGTGVGFWWQVENGVSVTNTAHKAYLKVPNNHATGAKGFIFGDSTTGITTINDNDFVNGDVEWYTIDGKRIDKPTRGVNIIKMSDGTTRKVIIK